MSGLRICSPSKIWEEDSLDQFIKGRGQIKDEDQHKISKEWRVLVTFRVNTRNVRTFGWVLWKTISITNR